MELLVVVADGARIGQALGRRHQPHRFSPRARAKDGCWRRAAPRSRPEHDPQVVELLGRLKSIGSIPAELGFDQEALVAQRNSASRTGVLLMPGAGRVTSRKHRRRPAGSRGSARGCRRLLGELARPRRRGVLGGAHGAIRLTCAATTRQPSGSAPRSGFAGRCGRCPRAGTRSWRWRSRHRSGDPVRPRVRASPTLERAVRNADRLDADGSVAP